MTPCFCRPNSTWSFLIPYKSAAQNLPRVSLVTEMLKNSDVARFVASLLPTAIKKGLGHRVLVTFNAATLHDFIKRSKSLNEGTVAYLLPSLLEPLQQKPKKLMKDAVVSFLCLLISCLDLRSTTLAWKLYSASLLGAKVRTFISCIEGHNICSGIVRPCCSWRPIREFARRDMRVPTRARRLYRWNIEGDPPHCVRFLSSICDAGLFIHSILPVVSRTSWPVDQPGLEVKRF